MYTQCPVCKKQHIITVKELRKSQGMVCCTQCSSSFNALELLNDGTVPDIKNIDQIQPSLESSSKTTSVPWAYGFSLSLIMLLFQIYFFEGYTLTQNASLRPGLEKICHHFDCELPHYKNLSEFTILHGSFEPTINNTYVFETVFTNQSAFVQSNPSIKLTLIDFTGHPFAERVFRPQEYSNQTPNLIKPEMSVEITLNIASPSNKIGGYRFELI